MSRKRPRRAAPARQRAEVAQRKSPARRRSTRANKKPRPKPAQSHPLRRSLGSVAISVIVAWLGLFFWSVSARPPRLQEDWILFEVAPGRDQVLRDLYHEQLIDSPLLMSWYMQLFAPFTELRPGPHLLEQGLSARQLLRRLSGDPARAMQNVTLVEGYNRWQVADRLHKKGIVPRSAFLAAVANQQLMDELAVPADSAEGYLFPATYPLALDSEAEDLVRRFVRESKKRYAGVVAAAEKIERPAVRLTEHEVITLASVVEKETGVASERAKIAQVFLNRLAQPEAETRGRLQSDPTAAYGCRLAPEGAPSCELFSGKITPKMLADAQNPYNTYRHEGLPPGPIANPGTEALAAVVEPAGGDELFFVADGKGGHRFSRTYEEHRKAVKQLRDLRGRDFSPP